MPELPEVESIREYIHSNFYKQKVQNLCFNRLKYGKSMIVSFPMFHNHIEEVGDDVEFLAEKFSALFVGSTFAGAKRIGKFLLLNFFVAKYIKQKFYKATSNLVIVVHLRMSGMFVDTSCWHLKDNIKKHCNFTLHFHKKKLHFVDVRTFATVQCFFDSKLAEEFIAAKKMGADATNLEILNSRFANELISHMPIKNYLLNQQKVMGLGNIYASESLFLAGISPFAKSSTLTPLQRDRLIKCIVGLMHFAIVARGVTIEKNAGYRLPNGKAGNFMANANVYKRDRKLCVGRIVALVRLANFFANKNGNCSVVNKKQKVTKKIANKEDATNTANVLYGENKGYSLTLKQAGYFFKEFLSYASELETCGGVIEKIKQTGRSTYYCPNCQKQ